MNRKRDLENVALIYESHFGAAVRPSRPRRDDQQMERPTYKRSPKRQMETIKHLNDRGWSVNKLRTKIDGVHKGEVFMSKNEPESREAAEELIIVDVKGNVNGQPFDIGFANASEDEQTSAFGQELADEAEDQNPVENYEDEEVQYQVGDKVKVNAQRSLDDLRSGRYGTQDLYLHGVISHIDDDNVQIDTDQGTMEVSINDIVKKEEEAEDLGPNQQPESWGDEAMGSEKPGQTSQRFAQNTPDNKAYAPHIPNEQEEDDMDLEKAVKVINNYLKARVHGDESHASKEVRDAKKAYIKDFVKKRKKDEDELGQAMAYKKITGNEVKKESYNSHGDRDMTLLAENYLNIKHHE